MEHPFTAHQVTSAVLNHVVKLHGLPNSIVSDRDRIFTSSFWKELFKLLDKKLLMSTSYHPQTDGQSERVNQCLEMYLRCTVQQSPTKWKNWLPLAELWYNSSSLFIEMLPIQGPLGYEPRLTSFPVLSLSTAQGMPSLLAERDTHVQLIKNNLAVAQTRIMHQADKNRVDRQFQVGDLVLLRLHPYAQSTVAIDHILNLHSSFFGPYKVLQKIGTAAYKIELPEGSMVHPTFHVSQLKPFSADYSLVYSDLAKIPDLTSLEVTPESILQRRLVKKGNNVVVQVLVKWSHLLTASATWED
jgi:hypothetical protein